MRRPFRAVLRGSLALLALAGGAALTLSGTGAPVQAQAQTEGSWTAPTAWPIVAVHAHLTPQGKVMFYPYSDDPREWDPANPGVVTAVTKVGYNIFCTGHSWMADGRLFVTGGHRRNGYGLPEASIFNPANNTWQRLPDMNRGRWYPTQVTLANGDVLTFTGSYNTRYANNTLPQVWQTATGSWRDLTGAQMGHDLYPAAHLTPDGRVFVSIPSTATRFLDTSGAGSWSAAYTRPGGYRGYGSAVPYDDGKLFLVGGGDPPLATAQTVDISGATPVFGSAASMSVARRQINATLMADGRILVTGGSSAPGFNEPSGAVLYGEIWDPATNSWTRTPGYQRYRGYHSTALLLPDGRIISMGGDNEPNMEIYSPAYLGGTRPAISGAPASVAYGAQFSLQSDQAISKVHLIRIGSVTHATNMDQRILRPAFSQSGNTVTITAPSSRNLCPPGHYMVFCLNAGGTPGVAPIVRIN